MTGRSARRGSRAPPVPVAGGVAVAPAGRPARTPAGRPLVVRGARLAAALAAEVDAAGVAPGRAGPLTGLANAVIDRIAPRRAEAVGQVAAYGASDLLCFRADGPEDLVARQAAQWQPLLDWADAAVGARLRVTAGVVPVAQPPEALAALRAAVAAFDDFELGAVGQITAAAGSLVIALALAAGRLTAAEAFAASRLDETFQMEAWGEDGEAMARRAACAADLEVAARFLALHRAA